MTETYRNVPLVPDKSARRLNTRQLDSYRDHRQELIDWLLDWGKDPERGKGYAESTVTIRSYRLDRFYREVWAAEGGYTQDIRPVHADAWLAHFDDKPVSQTYKASRLKALKSLFEWRADRTNSEMTWEPAKQFNSDAAHQPRDFLTKDERRQLREAALTYNATPDFYDADDPERDATNATLAMRYGKPKAEVSIEDWQRSESWKVPSIVWCSLDAGLRPVEISRAKVSWVDLKNGVLRIPKEDSAKNTENWHSSITERTVNASDRWLAERDRREKSRDGRPARHRVRRARRRVVSHSRPHRSCRRRDHGQRRPHCPPTPHSAAGPHAMHSAHRRLRDGMTLRPEEVGRVREHTAGLAAARVVSIPVGWRTWIL